MQLEITGDRVLIEMESPDEETSGGIIIPQRCRENKKIGYVIAAGTEVKEVKSGDTVLFDHNFSVSVDIDSTKYWACKEKRIMAVIESERKIKSPLVKILKKRKERIKEDVKVVCNAANKRN